MGESGSRRSGEEAAAASRSEMTGPAVSAGVVRNGEPWLDWGPLGVELVELAAGCEG